MALFAGVLTDVMSQEAVSGAGRDRVRGRGMARGLHAPRALSPLRLSGVLTQEMCSGVRFGHWSNPVQSELHC